MTGDLTTRTRRSSRAGWWLLGAAYAVALALVVFTPIQWWLNRLTVRLYVLFRYDLPLAPDGATPETYGDLLNVILFVPVGILLVALRRWSWPVAALVAVVVSGGIELVQGLPLIDRDPSLVDVVTNGLGGLIGAVLAAALRARRSPAR